MDIIQDNESNVRSYCRSFPAVFNVAEGSYIIGENGTQYIDFLAGAGALNYGHNNPYIKKDLVDFIDSNHMVMGLDLYTTAKRAFIEQFNQSVLSPKGLNYKYQFCGPTGTNAVEAALKLARKITGRQKVFSFMGGFHGMTNGSLSVTGNKYHREGSGLSLGDSHFMPFPNDGFMSSFDSIEYMETVLDDPNSGIETPAAVIVETVQGEGGVNIAPVEWLQRLRKLCDQYGIILIFDEIQVGCFRTGTFFSFERADITPDMILLSKSLSGYGLPLSLVLLKPELDAWGPGQHNGTFRGNQMAFVTAASALRFADENKLEEQVEEKGKRIQNFVEKVVAPMDARIKTRGIGMLWGIDFSNIDDQLPKKIAGKCFEDGLIIEITGRHDCVLKIMPALTIEENVLSKGLDVIHNAIRVCLENHQESSNLNAIQEEPKVRVMQG